jgi:hypothetical protein
MKGEFNKKDIEKSNNCFEYKNFQIKSSLYDKYCKACKYFQ